VLPDGETVSVDGTHLGHNLPDRKGRRYCINLVSIAGRPRSRTTNSTTSSMESGGRGKEEDDADDEVTDDELR